MMSTVFERRLQDPGDLARAFRRVHFVGIGGVGMSGIAEVLCTLGYEVSGSDAKATEITDRLETCGLAFFEGHDAANIGDAGILVVSAAIAQDNPEIVAAKERGIPVLHRSELLADLMRLKPHAVAVGGTVYGATQIALGLRPRDLRH